MVGSRRSWPRDRPGAITLRQERVLCRGAGSRVLRERGRLDDMDDYGLSADRPLRALALRASGRTVGGSSMAGSTSLRPNSDYGPLASVAKISALQGRHPARACLHGNTRVRLMSAPRGRHGGYIRFVVTPYCESVTLSPARAGSPRPGISEAGGRAISRMRPARCHPTSRWGHQRHPPATCTVLGDSLPDYQHRDSGLGLGRDRVCRDRVGLGAPSPQRYPNLRKVISSPLWAINAPNSHFSSSDLIASIRPSIRAISALVSWRRASMPD